MIAMIHHRTLIQFKCVVVCFMSKKKKKKNRVGSHKSPIRQSRLFRSPFDLLIGISV